MDRIIEFKHKKILCQYKNETHQIQILKLIDFPMYFERTILPMSTIKFEASSDSQGNRTYLEFI